MNKARIVFHVLGRLMLVLVAAGTVLPAAAASPLPHNPTNYLHANRWLIIVETSRAMQRRAEGARQIAANLIAYGMNGQMRPGDTVGVWTFSDTLHTGEFPLQHWTPSSAKTAGERVYRFLQERPFEKESRLDQVIPSLNDVVKDSPFITVILLTEGSTPMRGTRFDNEINASYKAWQGEQRKTEMPFLTLLRGQAGKMTHYAVNTPPFPLELPPLPEELFLERPVPAAVADPVRTPATLPPLILSGRKPEPPAAAAPVVEPPKEVPPAAVAEAKAPATAATPPKVEPVPAPATIQPGAEAIAPRPQEPERVPAVTDSAAARDSVTAPEKGVVQLEATRATPAVAVPVESKSNRVLWIALAAGVPIVLLALVLWIRSSRQKPHASLITRSLDRQQ